MRAFFQKKWIKIPYQITLYSFAIYGFFLVGTFLAMKFKLTNEDFKTKGLLTRFEVLFDSPEARMDCVRFCFEHGILFPGFCSLAVSHTAEQMQRLVDTLKKWRDK